MRAAVLQSLPFHFHLFHVHFVSCLRPSVAAAALAVASTGDLQAWPHGRAKACQCGCAVGQPALALVGPFVQINDAWVDGAVRPCRAASSGRDAGVDNLRDGTECGVGVQVASAALQKCSMANLDPWRYEPLRRPCQTLRKRTSLVRCVQSLTRSTPPLRAPSCRCSSIGSGAIGHRSETPQGVPLQPTPTLSRPDPNSTQARSSTSTLQLVPSCVALLAPKPQQTM